MNREASPGAGLLVACAAVRRVQRRDKYIPRDYEVFLCRDVGSRCYFLPGWKISVDQDPSKAALEHLQQHTSLNGTIAHPLTVFAKPVGDHSITLFYAVPVPINDTSLPASCGFHSLADVLENSNDTYDLKLGHMEMLLALDRWLYERHVIPFVNPDLVFLCSREGEGVGGLVKAIIENPVYNAHIRPPEDDLVISLNNPVF